MSMVVHVQKNAVNAQLQTPFLWIIQAATQVPFYLFLLIWVWPLGKWSREYRSLSSGLALAFFPIIRKFLILVSMWVDDGGTQCVRTAGQGTNEISLFFFPSASSFPTLGGRKGKESKENSLIVPWTCTCAKRQSLDSHSFNCWIQVLFVSFWGFSSNEWDFIQRLNVHVRRPYLFSCHLMADA